MTAAAASPISARRRIPTDSELFDAEREYRTLCDVTIPGFYSGRSGRYHATDTAKKNMLHSSVLRGLRFGKLPSDEDRRALFMDHWDKLSKADRKWMTEWRTDVTVGNGHTDAAGHLGLRRGFRCYRPCDVYV